LLSKSIETSPIPRSVCDQTWVENKRSMLIISSLIF